MECRKQNHNAGEHSDIADTVNNKRFLSGIARGFLLEPMSDKQIGAQTNQLPEHIHHPEIVRDNDAEHRKCEDTEVCKISTVTHIAMHIAYGEQMHQCAYDIDN